MVVSVELASSHHCCRQLGGREQVLQGLFKYHAPSLVAKAKLGKTPMSRQGHVNGLRWDLNRPQSWLGTFEGLSKQKLHNRAHWAKKWGQQCRGHWAGRREHCTVQWQHWHVTNVSLNMTPLLPRRQQKADNEVQNVLNNKLEQEREIVQWNPITVQAEKTY